MFVREASFPCVEDVPLINATMQNGLIECARITLVTLVCNCQRMIVNENDVLTLTKFSCKKLCLILYGFAF